MSGAGTVVAAAAYEERVRREYWVGAPTVAAIVGQKFVPGLLDWYLGRTGYESQQLMDEPRPPDYVYNLYHYVPGKHSAHGKFDSRSANSSAEVDASLHKTWFALGAAALAVAGGVLAVSARSKPKKVWWR